MSNGPAVLSVDLEFFSHTPAYRSAEGTLEESAVGMSGVQKLLDGLAAQDAKTTFFTVADIAEDHPALIEEVAAAGHELASHTYTHRHLSEIDVEERRSELRRSRQTLEDVSQTGVTGFRAPSFDLPDGSFRTLHEVGYEYDSSVIPCRRIPGWYGGGPRVDRPCAADAIDSGAPAEITELPVGVMPGIRLPLTGTWLRFFGIRYTLTGMRLLANRGITPIVYIHPWELVDIPRIDGVPSRIYWRTGAWMERAVNRILDEPYDFVTARTIVEAND